MCRISQHRRSHQGCCRRRIQMKSFTYERFIDPKAAGQAATRPGARFISGGTNLLDLMKLEIEQPSHLVDISRLPLRRIEDLPMAACGSGRWRQTPRSPAIDWCENATVCSRK